MARSGQLRRRRWLVPALSLAVTAGLLAAVLATVDLGELSAALASARLSWLGLALAIALFFKTVQSAETARWILRGLGQRVPFGPILVGTLGGLALREVLPSGTGNLTRAAWLTRRHDVPAAATATTEVAALWIKLAWLLLFCSAGILVTAEVDDSWAAISAGGLVVWVGTTAFVRPLVRLGRARLGGRERVERLLGDLESSLGHLEPLPWALVGFHTLASIVGEWVVYALVLVALGSPVPFGAIVAFVPVVAILTKLPISFMGFGAREALMLALFAPWAPGPVLVAAGLITSGIDRIAPTLLGSVVTPLFLTRLLEPER